VTEYVHNSWRHKATQQTPHELLLGFKPQVHVKFLPENVPASIERIQPLKDTREQTQKLLKTMQRNKDAQKITEMKTGDQVWLEGKNLHVKGTCKLLPKQYGPFTITE
jgi:hypothetical protein